MQKRVLNSVDAMRINEYIYLALKQLGDNSVQINEKKGEEMKTDEQYANDAVRVEKICQARERHGKPFAHEAGSEWKPRAIPVLTEWMQSRGVK